MRLIVRTDAEAEIAAGYGWYEEQQRGLGLEFLEELSSTIAAIASQPLRFPRVSRILRRAASAALVFGGIVFIWIKISPWVERRHVESMTAPPRDWRHYVLGGCLLLLAMAITGIVIFIA